MAVPYTQISRIFTSWYGCIELVWKRYRDFNTLHTNSLNIIYELVWRSLNLTKRFHTNTLHTYVVWGMLVWRLLVCKCGTDLYDRLSITCGTNRRSKHMYYLRLVFNIMDQSLINSRIAYQAIHPNKTETSKEWL